MCFFVLKPFFSSGLFPFFFNIRCAARSDRGSASVPDAFVSNLNFEGPARGCGTVRAGGYRCTAVQRTDAGGTGRHRGLQDGSAGNASSPGRQHQPGSSLVRPPGRCHPRAAGGGSPGRRRHGLGDRHVSQGIQRLSEH